MKFSILIVFFALQTLLSTAIGQTYGRNAMVVSDNKLASEVGISVLKNGGNAIDAAIAVAFALEVTHPAAGNIGGGGFLVYMKSDGNTTTIDFREKAPFAATENLFLNDKGQLPKAENLYGNSSTVNHIGAKSIGVPGTVAGLFLAHQKYGSMEWKKLLQPSIDLASEGFPLPYNMHQDGIYFKSHSPVAFLQNYFLNENGKICEFGEIWKQPELANTLKIIQEKGKDGFYFGEVAKELIRYIQENGGIMSEKDLAEYAAIERKPMQGKFKNYDIISMPPPSSGGVALVEMLNIVENESIENIPFGSAAYVHLMAETMRRAFADRAVYLGDPDFNNNLHLDSLLSKKYAYNLFKTINPTKASNSLDIKTNLVHEGDQTTHFSVIDKDHNAVSVTYTLEHSYGSGMGSEKLGFLLNNEMGDFNPIPKLTNINGLIGTKPNLIAPGKRMLSSMTPTIVAKNGIPYIIVGSPGGRTIINTVFQTIFAALAYEMPINKAIEALKIHHQWFPDSIYYEDNLLSPDSKVLLENMGHKLEPVGNLGDLMGIQYDEEKKVYVGYADSASSNGAAVGY